MENNLILDQWCVIEKEFHPHKQHHRETIFTIGNGYLSTRGSFEERFPGDRQATLVHGVWDDVPIVFTELANTPDWTSLEIWINDRPFNLKEGSYSGYQRSLNLQSGILSRKLFWSPENQNHIICLEFERFSSLADQHILVSSLKITPKNGNIRARARASLNSLVENEGILHWNCIYQDSDHHHANLLVETRKTKKLLAMSASLSTEGGIVEKSASDCCGSPGIEIKSFLQEGETLTIYKYVGIATSRDTEEPIQLAKEKATLAFHTGYKELKNANLESWDHFWQTSDVIIDGDKVAQTAIRHALFQLRIAAPSCDERVSIGAKTLSGFGYRGHVFWDTEIFILPFFILTQPEISRNLLMYRYHTLSGARRKAAENGYKGAQYSWESAETGDEVTPTWVPDFHNPLRLIRIWTGDIELHISADIVYALHQYWKMTGDDEFWIEVGIPILLETSLFYGERVEFERDHYSIRDIIGPDEYHEHIDNNVYTNRMIQWQLKLAQEALDWVKINDLNQYQPAGLP